MNVWLNDFSLFDRYHYLSKNSLQYENYNEYSIQSHVQSTNVYTVEHYISA